MVWRPPTPRLTRALQDRILARRRELRGQGQHGQAVECIEDMRTLQRIAEKWSAIYDFDGERIVWRRADFAVQCCAFTKQISQKTKKPRQCMRAAEIDGLCCIHARMNYRP